MLDRMALAYLERFASSSENLRRVLARKVERRCRLRGEAPEAALALVEEAVARAVRGGLVDDAAYAQGRVASLRRRGGSRRAIAARLSAKGVAPETIDAALAGDAEARVADDPDADPEMEAALALARRRRLGPFRTAARAENRERDLARLARAGFSYGVARAVVDAQDG
ncbi:RecX family transcriptional regulator [Salinarimonas rosea]|uniref:RecX family transcriptional regulator n=1 Tax=Salinarimonas rosea TaxID=552063 RepID=UPI001FDA8FF9|nr:RecX family transcriptional regulator [Salinarimonas rosea]